MRGGGGGLGRRPSSGRGWGLAHEAIKKTDTFLQYGVFFIVKTKRQMDAQQSGNIKVAIEIPCPKSCEPSTNE